MSKTFSTAVHEAGHAVASWHLLAKPLGCRLFVEGDTCGGVATASPVDEATPTHTGDPLPDQTRLVFGIDQQSVIREAVTDAAGYAAQIELLSEDTPRTRREETTPDLLRVRAAILALDTEADEITISLFEEMAFRMARNFCRKYSNLILKIAGQLHEKHQLSQADVLRLVYPNAKILD